MRMSNGPRGLSKQKSDEPLVVRGQKALEKKKKAKS